ncbi:hypothetical protein CrLKS4_g50 [Cylindrospermopsis phage Cr-LKS4]|jgi:hypothetical protein|nr:hypothetical protein CrLKS4_g50 [Cylindrospermopsis phage Cr-LKS4]
MNSTNNTTIKEFANAIGMAPFDLLREIKQQYPEMQIKVDSLLPNIAPDSVLGQKLTALAKQSKAQESEDNWADIAHNTQVAQEIPETHQVAGGELTTGQQVEANTTNILAIQNTIATETLNTMAVADTITAGVTGVNAALSSLEAYTKGQSTVYDSFLSAKQQALTEQIGTLHQNLGNTSKSIQSNLTEVYAKQKKLTQTRNQLLEQLKSMLPDYK